VWRYSLYFWNHIYVWTNSISLQVLPSTFQILCRIGLLYQHHNCIKTK
jgi:hypothetical protein